MYLSNTANSSEKQVDTELLAKNEALKQVYAERNRSTYRNDYLPYYSIRIDGYVVNKRENRLLLNEQHSDLNGCYKTWTKTDAIKTYQNEFEKAPIVYNDPNYRCGKKLTALSPANVYKDVWFKNRQLGNNITINENN